MTFNELKQEILNRAKLQDVCGTYQDILIAPNEAQLVAVSLPLLEWAYRSGIVDDTLINEVSNSTLEDNGIYRSGTHSLSNPSGVIYILGNSNVDIEMTGNSKCTFYIQTTGVVNIIAHDNSYSIVKMFSGTLTLTTNDNSIGCVEMRNSQTSNFTTNNTSVVHIKCYESNILNINTNNDSFIKLQGFFDSITYGNEASSIPVDAMMAQKAIYNNNIAL
ncbi:MAG: hypothetical protein LC112_14005 [Flavobacteriales bacterium]|nr:hypothetical protein [Flavobacteriales bacterium]